MHEAVSFDRLYAAVPAQQTSVGIILPCGPFFSNKTNTKPHGVALSEQMGRSQD